MVEYITMLSVSIMFVFMSLSSYYVADKNPNPIIGYRTKKSIKSKMHWRLANRTFGKYSGITALITVSFSLLTLFSYSEVLLWIHLSIMLIGLVYGIIQTEKKLKELG